MLILALDTTTRPGSAALVRDDRIVDVSVGESGRTHGERLPGDLLTLVARHRLRLRDIDLYAVAAGPGSFTGLRIGIACIQGLALANDRGVVPVSALDALALASREAPGVRRQASGVSNPRHADMVAVWMDAQRGQVFSRTYAGEDGGDGLEPLDDARVGDPLHTLRGFDSLAPRARTFIGDGAVRYAGAIREVLGADARILDAPPLAGLVGRLAYARAAEAVHPAAIQPIYVRRPDAELARERASADTD